MSNTRQTTLEEVEASDKLADAIAIAERNLTGVANSFGGVLDQNVTLEIQKSLTFILSNSSSGSSFFEQIFEQGLGNFFENYKDLGSILNSYRSIYIPEEIAKNISNDLNEASGLISDLATAGIKNQTIEDIQKISAKKFLKESYENCFMRLMGLPTSNNLKNYVSYMDFGTGELSTLFGSDRVPQKVLDILDERQEIIVKKVETLDNTFYDVSKINIGDIDPFALLDKSVSLILKNAESGALRLIANDKLNVADLSSDEVFTYYTRALEIISNQEFNAGRQKTYITKSYIDSIKGNGAFREIFEFLFYGKIKGLPILNLANELKSYSHLMFPPVQDFRIHKCIAERGKYIAPPFEHQTGFRINNERPVMSFLEGILRIRLDKLSGYDPSQVVSISKNSSTSNQYRLEDVDGAYSILESIMINRMIATLKICSKRLSKSCKSYVKNAIKANITITTTKTPVADPTTQGSQSSPSDPEKKASTKNILSPNSPTSVQEETLNVLQTIEDSMVLLLGDTSKGLDIQNGTLRKSTITDTPLMNILVSSITIPSKYIKKSKIR